MSDPRLLITRLCLEDIKSYQGVDVSLPPGTIAICGSNGAGKSTLIEAIGFALFGSQRVKQEQLIREGCAHGRIDITFISGLDGLPYTVTRELRREGASSARLHSDAHGFSAASGVRDVQAELAQHLGLRDGVGLDTLFDGVIGVPQGQLTGDFLLSPAPRRARFEELLALQEFNTVYQRLSGPLAYGRDRLSHASGRLTALADRIAASQNVRAELVDLQARLGQLQRRAAGLTRERDSVIGEREALDRSEASLRQAREALGATGTAAQLARQRRAEAERRWKEAADAGVLAEATRVGYDRYRALEGEARELDRLRANRDLLERDLGALQTDLARLETTADGLTNRLQSVTEAERTADGLKPAAERQSVLETRLSEVKNRLALRSELESSLKARELERDELSGRLAILSERASSIEAAEAEAQEASQAIDRVARELADFGAEIRAKETESSARRQAEKAVRRGEASECPVCLRPFAEGDAAGFLQHLREELAALERALAELKAKRAALEREIERQRHRHQQAQRAVQQARDAATGAEAAQGQLSAIAVAMAATADRLRDLIGLDDEEKRIADELLELADPRGRMGAALAIASERARLAGQLSETQTLAASVSTKRDALLQRLSQHADLDQRLAENAEERDLCRADYESHSQVAPLAAQASARLAELEAQRAAVQTAESELQAATQTLALAEGSYDPDRHLEVRQQEHSLDIELTRLRSEANETDRRLGEAGARLAELEGLEEEQRSLTLSTARDRRAIELLAFLRDTIRNAGPEIARLVLARVSQAAAITYSELMGDHASTVAWGDDYGITVERAGQTRAFVQLSGGEQVAAALSVRLALLREVSDLRLAFFDEPTINLDEDRRRSLAEQLRTIRDLDQLFVISHDDSLESVTDNVIRVSKENGLSTVEAS